MPVAEITDKDVLRNFLQKRPFAAAYMLGDLDPRFFHFCTWHGLFDGDDLASLLMLYRGLRVPVLITFGAAKPIQHLINAVVMNLPRRMYCHIEPDHEYALSMYFRASELKSTYRMGVTPVDFKPVEDCSPVCRLSHMDTAGILQLYQHYPDAFFEPYQLESGFYYGIREAEQLASIAGVHVLSIEDNIAAIGNVVTHPEFRRRGFSSACVSSQLADLFKHVSRVALNVREANVVALSAFGRLGFKKYAQFLEGNIEKHR